MTAEEAIALNPPNPNPVNPVDEERKIPVINDNVAVPDLQKNLRLSINDALAAVPGSSLRFIVDQYFIVLPAFLRNTDEEDYYSVLRAAAS